MADNVTLNSMSGGEDVATDDVTVTGQAGAGQVQFMKLVDGTANGTAPIAVDVGGKANALRTAPASDITDGTYVGDIKFGESLPAGTNGIGKLTANTGVDIGDVDILSVPAPLNVVGGGTEAAAQRVTIANDSTGVVTVDGTVTANPASGTIDTVTTVGAVTAITDALPAGTNLLGTVGIDQTTDGTTNKVAATLHAGTAEIGKLAAGTAAIGKLATNTGVDIGDVDVTSIANASINGPGVPVIDSYTQVAINLTTAANQVLVASAANKQIWVYGYGLSCGDADGQTVSLQDEDDTALTGIMEFAQYGGISVPPSGNFAMPIFKLGTDKDLEIDIGGGDVDGFLTYAIVSV